MARDVEGIPGAGGAAAEGSSGRRATQQNDVREDVIGRGLAGVSAGKRNGMGAGKGVEAGKEAGKPGAAFTVGDNIGRQRKG